MKINIGSKNPNKIEAVRSSFKHFQIFEDTEFVSVNADSEVSDQPIGYEPTITGANNRAVNAFSDCTFSIGLESGLIPVPLTKTGYMNLTVCSIYNGSKIFHGIGPAFELPQDVTKYVVNENMELDDAVKKSGLSDNPRIGYSQGIIGIMSENRVTRKDYMIPAVHMALISVVHETK